MRRLCGSTRVRAHRWRRRSPSTSVAALRTGYGRLGSSTRRWAWRKYSRGLSGSLAALRLSFDREGLSRRSRGRLRTCVGSSGRLRIGLIHSLPRVQRRTGQRCVDRDSDVVPGLDPPCPADGVAKRVEWSREPSRKADHNGETIRDADRQRNPLFRKLALRNQQPPRSTRPPVRSRPNARPPRFRGTEHPGSAPGLRESFPAK